MGGGKSEVQGPKSTGPGSGGRGTGFETRIEQIHGNQDFLCASAVKNLSAVRVFRAFAVKQHLDK